VLTQLRIAKNSVGTKQLKNNAVTAAKIKKHSLLANNFEAGQSRPGRKESRGRRETPGRRETRVPRRT